MLRLVGLLEATLKFEVCTLMKEIESMNTEDVVLDEMLKEEESEMS